jgi:PPOX class probable FMN-dependent enzyme
MTCITTLDALDALYGAPSEAARVKVAQQLTPTYARWITQSRFCLIATVGPDGTDCSPRGDDGPVVAMLDETTLAMPDWRGNNRIDSLRNIVQDGRISVTFMVPGSANVVRVNGRARLTTAPNLITRFERKGVAPRCVIVIELAEVYIQCARAILRSRLWSGGSEHEDLPSVGDILAERTDGALDGRAFDTAWAARADGTMW